PLRVRTATQRVNRSAREAAACTGRFCCSKVSSRSLPSLRSQAATLLAATEDESATCAILEPAGGPVRAPPLKMTRCDAGLGFEPVSAFDFDPHPADDG
ncbi:MAG: hypothetical protein OSB10_08590, partial [Planctomycetota bacterium]|nr:hypothetical protein [Planctomycetota bacterium]